MDTILSADYLSINIRYMGILLCFIVSLVVVRKTPHRRDAYHQAVCLFFAVIADFFLLYTEFFLVGIMIFWGAHICAIRRYRIKLFFPSLIIAVVCGTMCLILAGKGDFAVAGTGDFAVNAASFIYGLFISLATVSTFFYRQEKINNICSRLGMCLFVACDINVALFNILPHDAFAFSVAARLMWTFYLPAQMLLSLSAADFKTKLQSYKKDLM